MLFFKFFTETIQQLERQNQIRTSETYKSAFHSFALYVGGEELLINQVNSELIKGYEVFLKQRGVSMNTVSFYMRILRAVYNRAVEQGLVDDKKPFRNVYVGVEKTIKRAIPLSAVKQLKEIEFQKCSNYDIARDLFLFSFYTRGMSFVDMAYLKKSDIRNGMLVYCRRKTRQKLFVALEACMQAIIDKYPSNETDYLLPIITKKGNERQQYINALRLTNRLLKDIAKQLHLPFVLTTYVARHTWASVAKSKNIPISVISEGMGHNSESTTQIYLASLDNILIDEANKLILGEI